MTQLIMVILIIAIALGVYQCSDKQTPPIQQQLEQPKRVEEKVQQELIKGMQLKEEKLESEYRQMESGAKE